MILHVDELNYVNAIGKRVLQNVSFGIRSGEVVGRELLLRF